MLSASDERANLVFSREMLTGIEGRGPILKQDQATRDNEKNVSVRGEGALLGRCHCGIFQ